MLTTAGCIAATCQWRTLSEHPLSGNIPAKHRSKNLSIRRCWGMESGLMAGQWKQKDHPKIYTMATGARASALEGSRSRATAELHREARRGTSLQVRS